MPVEKKSRKKPISPSTISPEDLVREFPGAKRVTHEAGAYIFREGSKADSCYVITKGKVQILKKTRKTGTVPLATVKPGEFLGEMAMLSG